MQIRDKGLIQRATEKNITIKKEKWEEEEEKKQQQQQPLPPPTQKEPINTKFQNIYRILMDRKVGQ